MAYSESITDPYEKVKELYFQNCEITHSKSFKGLKPDATTNSLHHFTLTEEFTSPHTSTVNPVDHTMVYALPYYCIKRIPIEYLNVAIQEDNGTPFCVWGVYDAHFPGYAESLGLEVVEFLTLKQKPKRDPTFNKERPKLWKVKLPPPPPATPLQEQQEARKESKEAEKYMYVLTAFPGSDYVYHYARCVRQCLELLKPGIAESILEIRRFPEVERTVASWTNLVKALPPTKPGDVVVMGHVRDFYNFWVHHYTKNGKIKNTTLRAHAFQTTGIEMNGLIKDAMDKWQHANKENREKEEGKGEEVDGAAQEVAARTLSLSHFTEDIKYSNYAFASVTLESGKAVIFLGVRYSFWGDLCGLLAQEIYTKTNVSAIAYGAKTGALWEEGINSIVEPTVFFKVTEPRGYKPNGSQNYCEISQPIADVVPRIVPKCAGYASRTDGSAPCCMLVRELEKLVACYGEHDFISLSELANKANESGLVMLRDMTVVYNLLDDHPSVHITRTPDFKVKWNKGLHFSVPTVVGEDYSQRRLVQKFIEVSHAKIIDTLKQDMLKGGEEQKEEKKTKNLNELNESGCSIEDETANIAIAASKAHKLFLPVLCCTDYVRKQADAHTITVDDLAAENRDNIMEIRKEMAKRIYSRITNIGTVVQKAIDLDKVVLSVKQQLIASPPVLRKEETMVNIKKMSSWNDKLHYSRQARNRSVNL